METKATEATGQPPVTDQQATVEEAEAEQGLAAGFEKVRGKDDDTAQTEDTTTTEPAPKGADTQANPAAAPAAAAAPAKDPWEGVSPVIREQLQANAARLRNVEGHLGGINSNLKEIKAGLDSAKAAAAAGTKAPTETAIATASGSSEKWKKLQEDFPDWAEAMEERLSTVGKGPAVDVEGLKRDVHTGVAAAVRAGIDEAEEKAFVRLKHPTWKKDVNSPEFGNWLKTQPADIQRLCASPLADDTIKVLDSFAEHRKQVAKSTATQERNQRRLAGAVVPSGSGAVLSTGIDDDAAFTRGFKRATKSAR